MSFHQIDRLQPKMVFPGFNGRFVHSDQLTIAYWEIEAGALLPEHHHVHEQVALIKEGRFELTIAGETQVLKPGQIAVIPSNAPHSGRALTDCKITDIFQPVREDYKF